MRHDTGQSRLHTVFPTLSPYRRRLYHRHFRTDACGGDRYLYRKEYSERLSDQTQGEGDRNDLIFSAIEQNWWQEPRGESGIMQEMEAPVKALRMSSEDEIGEDDVLIIFQYDDPVAWKRADHAEGEPEYYQIQYYLFPLPDPEEEAEHPAWETRGGDMLISEDETFFGKSNVYQYYYSSNLYELVQEAMKKSCCRGLNKPGICGYNRHVIDQKEVET